MIKVMQSSTPAMFFLEGKALQRVFQRAGTVLRLKKWLIMRRLQRLLQDDPSLWKKMKKPFPATLFSIAFYLL
jgi:hypothetical protein